MDDDPHIWMYIILFMCILLSAYFSATETAFTSLNRLKIKSLAEKGNKKANKILLTIEKYDNLLTTILIGNNLVNIAATAIATAIYISRFGTKTGSGVATVVTTLVLLFFGEITPKTLAKRFSNEFSLKTINIINFFVFIFTPFNFIFNFWQKLLNKTFKNSNEETITEDEILVFIEEAEDKGEIDKQEKDLIKNAIGFNELTTEDILTPRVDITAINIDSKKEDIEKIFIETGYSRIPVYEGTVDNIVGILYLKDFYSKMSKTNISLRKIIRPALFTTSHKSIGELLKELQQKNLHIAVVVDEYGGTVGIVTLEDIMEEMFGEIWDEHDDVIPEITKVNETEYIVLGSTNTEKLFEEIGVDEDDSIDSLTINGLVMDLIERIPRKNDTCTYKNLKFKVIDMQDKIINRVKINILEEI